MDTDDFHKRNINSGKIVVSTFVVAFLQNFAEIESLIPIYIFHFYNHPKSQSGRLSSILEQSCQNAFQKNIRISLQQSEAVDIAGPLKSKQRLSRNYKRTDHERLGQSQPFYINL